MYTENMFIALYDEKTRLFSFPYFVDQYDSTPDPMEMSKSCTEYVRCKGKSMLINEKKFQELAAKNEVELVGSPSPSWLGVPLRIPTGIIGVLVLQHYEKENAYTVYDVKFLDAVASQIALVIEKKRAEEALKENELNLNVILHSTLDGILAVDNNGKVIKMNDRFIQLWKIPESLSPTHSDKVLLNHILSQLMEPQDFIKKVEALYNSKEESLDNLYFLDGRIFERYSSPLIMGDKIKGRVWSFRDITKQKVNEEKIIESNEQLSHAIAEKDKLFSIIAHDLRSPFIGILGLTEILREDVENFSKEELVDFSGQIHQEASHLYKLIENLLEWAQMQRGLISFKPEKTNLTDLIAHNIKTIRQRAHQKGITINFEVSDNVEIYADEKLVNTILRNLLANAVKFSSNNDCVTVSIKEIKKTMIEVSISDTGIGINENELALLFSENDKIRTKGTDGEPSTGLGLILCKDFVERHGGTIGVKSKINEGSTFYFTLPKNLN